MSFYTQFISQFLFPLHEKMKGHETVEKKALLDESQWFEKIKIQTQQQDRLVEFLMDIRENNHFYQQLFSELNLDNNALSQADVLTKLPILTKDIIRANEEQYLSELSENTIYLSTSGSSGTPLKFAVGNERISHDVAAKWRATNWWNVDIGDKEAVIWGSSVELSGQGIVKTLRDVLFRSKLFPAQHLDSKGIADLFARLSEFKPAMIYGYPSILTLLAEHAKTNGIKFEHTGLKVIFCTAEKLYQHQRDIIESVFNAPVANGYGSRDAGFIAHECSEGTLHISEEDVIVEVLNEQNEPCAIGEIGQLIVTNLTTRDFPMLRYNTGDLAVLSDKKCPCGRQLKVFSEVVGRSNDMLISTAGGIVHGAYIGNIIREDLAICHFQLTQLSRINFSVKLVGYPDKTIDSLSMIARLQVVLGEDANIICELVAEIDAESTGKFKYIINQYQPSS